MSLNTLAGKLITDLTPECNCTHTAVNHTVVLVADFDKAIDELMVKYRNELLDLKAHLSKPDVITTEKILIFSVRKTFTVDEELT